MPPLLNHMANRLLLDGEEVRKSGMHLSRYLQQLKRSPSSVATATEHLGMSREDDPVRVFVTGDPEEQPAIALGPSAGLVLGVSVGGTSVRAAIVDANGWIYNEEEGDAAVNQLAASPEELFGRVRLVCEPVLSASLTDGRLLVDGKLPFLGLAVAWPAPLDSDKVPRSALSHPDWQSNTHGIDQLLARHLQIPPKRSHALNDAAAATLAVAFDETRSPGYEEQRHPRQLIVIRAGAGLGASTIVVEPLEKDGSSGWMNSRITGGRRGLAGEIGHTPVDKAWLDALKAGRPRGCPAPKRVRCSCTARGKHPEHIEAYAGGSALAARFLKGKEDPAQVVARIVGDRENSQHRRALEETGMLLGDCLLPSVLMLSPHEIVLTGRLATPEVADGVESKLDNSDSLRHIFGGAPKVRALEGDENDYIRVRGAALAVLRRHVHRHIDDLYGASKKAIPTRFRELTEALDKVPWARTRRYPQWACHSATAEVTGTSVRKFGRLPIAAAEHWGDQGLNVGRVCGTCPSAPPLHNRASEQRNCASDHLSQSGGLGMFPAVVTNSWRAVAATVSATPGPISTYGKPT